MIKKKDGEFCVYSEDGSRSFGCYATKPEAEKRLAQVEYFKREGNMKRLLVNVNTAVNASMIRRETREGKEYIIIKSKTLPDNVVMNGGLYPAAEIEKGYKSLERTFAPIGHPHKSDGSYLSASDPEAISNFHAGAHNENVTRKNGVVNVDKVIDVGYAMKSDKGQRLLDRIKAIEMGSGAPIHTSTGLMLTRREAKGNSNGKDYTWVAANMDFDHDAILLDEPGAATPDDGVGIAVNHDGEQVEVVNAFLNQEETDEQINEEQKTMLTKLLESLGFAKASNPAYNSDSEYSQTNEVDPMKDKVIAALKKAGKYKENMSDDEAFNAFGDMMKGDKPKDEKPEDKAKNAQAKDQVDKGDETGEQMNAQVMDALAKMATQIEALSTQVNADKTAKREQLETAVVNAKLLTAESARSVSIEALTELAAQCNGGAGASFVNPAVATNQATHTYEMPE